MTVEKKAEDTREDDSDSGAQDAQTMAQQTLCDNPCKGELHVVWVVDHLQYLFICGESQCA